MKLISWKGSLLFLWLIALSARAAETPAPEPGWPMWQYDAMRRGATPVELPAELHLQWIRELPPPRRAWKAQRDDLDKLEFDLSYSPVTLGHTIFVPSTADDSLTAYRIQNGAELWRYYADGPIRLAPVAANGKVYFASDDGHLHCVDANTGKRLWRFRAGPSDHRVLGNGRIISLWPMRGGPVLKDGVVYVAAGIWPFMGIFVYALDAETGAIRWQNTGDGTNWQKQPHKGAFAFAGVAPQGHLVATEDYLVVPGGRALPAIFNRHTGELIHSIVDGKGAFGGYRVLTDGEYYYNHGKKYKLPDGSAAPPLDPAIIDNGLYLEGQDEIVRAWRKPDQTAPAKQEKKKPLKEGEFEKLWEQPVPGLRALHIQAGTRLFGDSLNGQIIALRLQPQKGEEDKTSPRLAVTELEVSVDAPVFTMLAARENLLVVTENGTLYCFGPKKTKPVTHGYCPVPPVPASDNAGRRAVAMIETLEDHEGHALFLGVGDGNLMAQLAAHSNFQIVGIDPDPAKIEILRRRFSDMALYGSRIALLQGDPSRMRYPPYISSLIVVPDPAGPGMRREAILAMLRPYGGKAFLGDGTVLSRDGALPDTGSWTHQHANAANTVVSRDELVRLPLGLLWFGGPNNEIVLPRHAAGPRPQVAGGRLVILGVETISARDVYTGRELWAREFPGIGHPFTDMKLEEEWRTGASVYMVNQPGAAYIGSPYVTQPDSIYLRYQRKIFRLDTKTGVTLSKFSLPATGGKEDQQDWGHISIWSNLLITTVSAQVFEGTNYGGLNWDATSSEQLAVMDRFSGKILWTRKAAIGFRHNAIATAAGKIFIIDGLSTEALGFLARRGVVPTEKATLFALNAGTGELVWQAQDDIFGTHLAYSEDYDILLEGGNQGSRRNLQDEPTGRMTARRGKDGALLWQQLQDMGDGPTIVRGDELIPARPGASKSLITGLDRIRRHPITGESIPWTYTKSYGCGPANAGQNLLLFRSGSAGFTDLENDSGSGSFGGFKSGCTASMIPADGVLSAPDYTRTCTCAYQNQTSLAMIHMPDAEVWTFNEIPWGNTAVRQLGLNLGAAGNRRADSGTLWLNYPQMGVPSPSIPAGITPSNAPSFRTHSALVTGSETSPAWIAASGVSPIESLQLALAPEGQDRKAKPYTVRLHFSDPDSTGSGQRVFDIQLQDTKVLSGLDIFAQAGGRNQSLVKEFTRVPVKDILTLRFQPAGNSKLPPLLCGVETILEQALEMSLRIQAGMGEELVYTDKDHVQGLLELQNISDRAITAQCTVGIGENPLLQQTVTLAPASEQTLRLAIPLTAMNSDRQLAVTADLGPELGEFRIIEESFPLRRAAPVEITKVEIPSLKKARILLQNRQVTDQAKDLELRVTAVVDGQTCLDKSISLPRGKAATLDCPLPESLIGRKVKVEVTTDWNASAGLPAQPFQTHLDFESLRVVPRLAQPIQVDGSLADWKDPAITLNTGDDVFPVKNRNAWKGTDDLSAELFYGWDGEALCLAARIRDDSHFNVKSGSDIWNGDVLQFAIVRTGDKPFTLGVALTDKGLQFHRWRGDNTGVDEQTQYAVVRDEKAKTTIYELRIPLQPLGIKLGQGEMFGFNAVFFDDDTGKGQKCWIQLAPGLAGGWKPDTLPQFTLEE